MKRWMMSLSMVVALLVMVAAPASADEKPTKLEVGKPAPTFELKDVEGKSHKLTDLRGQYVVIHFQSVTCPWEKAYQPTLNAFNSEYGSMKTEVNGKEKSKFVFLGINSNHTEKDDQVKKGAADWKIEYPILRDVGNKVADAYFAKTTPEIFIINPEGVLIYQGGLEKAPVGPSQANKSDEQYLKPVLHAIVNGSELPYTETVSIGCSIKRVRKAS